MNQTTDSMRSGDNEVTVCPFEYYAAGGWRRPRSVWTSNVQTMRKMYPGEKYSAKQEVLSPQLSRVPSQYHSSYIYRQGLSHSVTDHGNSTWIEVKTALKHVMIGFFASSLIAYVIGLCS